MALTKRQREMLDFIEGFVRFRGYSPSFEEIAHSFGYRSLATVHEHLTLDLPLYGTVAAGMPIEAIENHESIAVPENMISGSLSEHYVLRVRGSSMIEEQIRDGDYVIVQSRDTAYNGEMVIALVDGENATIKKFYQEDKQIRLQPANPGLDPMYFDPSRIVIQGIVIGVIRRY